MKEYLIPVYSGEGLFNDVGQYHPCFKIEEQWYVITHSKPKHSDYCEITYKDLEGEFYCGRFHERSYLLKTLSNPTRIANKVSGYFYSKPYFKFLGLTTNQFELMKVNR